MNLTELCEAVRNRGGYLARDQMATDAALTPLVNAALHDLETKRPQGWPWLRVADVPVAFFEGVGSVTFASLSGTDTWLKLRAVRVLLGTQWCDLEAMSAVMLRRRYPSTGEGMPTAWATDGYTLLVRPLPNDTWIGVIDAVLTEPDLVQPTDTPLMPATFHEVIVEQAVFKEKRRTGDNQGAQIAQQAVAAALADMRNYARTMTGPGTVTSRDVY